MKLWLIVLALSIALIPSASAWYGSYQNATFLDANPATGIFTVNASNATGTNNQSYIYFNGRLTTPDASDIAVVLDNSTSGISFWFDNDTSQSGGNIVILINKSISGSPGVVGIFYNNSGASLPSNFNLSYVMPYADGFNGRWRYSYTQGVGSQNWATQPNGTMMQTEATSNSNRNFHILQTSMPGNYEVVTKMKFITVPTSGRGGVQLGRDTLSNDIGAGISAVAITTQNTIVQDNVAFGTASLNSKTLVANEWFMVAGYTTGSTEQSKIYSVNKNDTQWQGSGGYVSSTTKYIGMYATAASASAFQYWYAWNGSVINMGTFGGESAVGTIGLFSNNLTNDEQTTFNSLVTVPILFNVTGTTITTDRYEWSVNGTNQSNNMNNFVYNFPSIGMTSINVTAVNTTYNMASTIIWNVTGINYSLQLLYPANNSVVSTMVNLTSREWPQHTPYTYHVCYDWNCNSVFSSGAMSNINTTDEVKNITLVNGITYYWYVSNSLGQSTLTRNFTVPMPTSDGTTGIQGIVYSNDNGIFQPIAGANVMVWNATYSTVVTTDTNGYYLVRPLANASTYNVQAKALNYLDGSVMYVTTNASQWYTMNLLMIPFTSPYVPNFVYEKFIVRGLFDNPFPGVTVTVMRTGSPTQTGITDSMGAVVFQLYMNYLYTVTFSGGGLSNPITATFYAHEQDYLITVMDMPTHVDTSAISANLSVSTVNATDSLLSVVYNDNSSTTSIVNFYVNRIDPSNTSNVTHICSLSSLVQPVTLSCSVLSAGVYQFGWNSTSSTFGFNYADRVVNFNSGNPNAPIGNIPVTPFYLNWIAIMLLVLTASLFSPQIVKFGAVIVPFEGLFLWYIGWLNVSFLIVGCAVCIGIMVYIRSSEVKTAY